MVAFNVGCDVALQRGSGRFFGRKRVRLCAKVLTKLVFLSLTINTGLKLRNTLPIIGLIGISTNISSDLSAE